MNSFYSAATLLVINVSLIWLLMAMPIGIRTIRLRREFRANTDTLWQAVNPLGPNAAWSPSLLSSEPVDGRTDLVRQAYTYPDRRGQPIVRLISLEEMDAEGPTRQFRSRVVEDSTLDVSYWRHFSERRMVAASESGTELVVEVTDRYRGLAMYLFRYFAIRRELNQLSDWIETGAAKAGGLIEHPITQVVSALLSTFILWLFFGMTDTGLMTSIILTTVIVLHEFGHMAAYRAFGHKSARMIFIPLLGGVAIGGRPYNSHFEVCTCALMGPGMSAFLVPITIAVFNLIADGKLPEVMLEPTLYFLLILGAFNLLNLLPMYRFDGGQVIRQIFPSRKMQMVGSFSIAAFILGVGWTIGMHTNALLAALAVFAVMGVMSAGRVKPRDALEPMTKAERLLSGFGLYATLVLHGYAIVFATQELFW